MVSVSSMALISFRSVLCNVVVVQIELAFPSLHKKLLKAIGVF